MIRGLGVVHSSDIDFVGQSFDHLLLQVVGVGEAQVSNVYVVLQSEGELPLGQVGLVYVAGTDPSDVRVVGKDTLVVNSQQLFEIAVHYWS